MNFRVTHWWSVVSAPKPESVTELDWLVRCMAEGVQRMRDKIAADLLAEGRL